MNDDKNTDKYVDRVSSIEEKNDSDKNRIEIEKKLM
jgi:hypothetical protein